MKLEWSAIRHVKMGNKPDDDILQALVTFRPINDTRNFGITKITGVARVSCTGIIGQDMYLDFNVPILKFSQGDVSYSRFWISHNIINELNICLEKTERPMINTDRLQQGSSVPDGFSDGQGAFTIHADETWIITPYSLQIVILIVKVKETSVLWTIRLLSSVRQIKMVWKML